MNARILTTAAVAALFCGVLPGRAADPAMLNLLMPDAKIVSGVNVQQAATSPFGMYVLSLLAPQDQQVQALATLIGFDPRRDVTEILMGSTGISTSAGGHDGLALARGNFALSALLAGAQQKGAMVETYKGVTILEDPKQTMGVAFLDADSSMARATLAALGPVAEVKAAIDRLSAASSLDAKLLTQIQRLSAAEDAWVVSVTPLAGLTPPAGAPQIPGIPSGAMLQNIQAFSGGVKFGANVAVTGAAVADTAQNAAALAGLLQFVVNLAQTQSAQNPQAAGLLKAVAISANNNVVNIAMSMPMDQLQQMLKPQTNAQRRAAPRPAEKKM